MSKRILLLAYSPNWAREFQNMAKTCSEVSVLDTANNLMDSYHQIETLEPEFVLVEDRFSELPEFEMLLALVSAIKSNIIVFSTPDKTKQQLTAKAGSYLGAVSAERALKALKATNEPIQSSDAASVDYQAGGSAHQPILLIGSSTGGIDALTVLLQSFPENCPPTVIVQHTGSSFGEGLAKILDRVCRANVRSFDGKSRIGTGDVILGAGKRRHVEVRKSDGWFVDALESEPVSGHIPSVDQLFRSAVGASKDVVAALLTGMGRDGAEGLLELRKSGARTFAQDKESSVVYGMPRIAWEIGAAEKQVGLKQMTKVLMTACQEVSDKRAYSHESR